MVGRDGEGALANLFEGAKRSVAGDENPVDVRGDVVDGYPINRSDTQAAGSTMTGVVVEVPSSATVVSQLNLNGKPFGSE